MKKFINPLQKFILKALIITVVSVGAITPSLNSFAQQSASPTDTELVDRIASEVVRRLLEDGTLARQITLGIEQFIEKQRQAQAGAQANTQAQQAAKAKNVRRVTPGRDHIYGSADALVSLIEYSDFECPYCKLFHPTAREIVDKSNGQVNWVYRHFPLGFHNPLAQQEAEAAECAGSLGGNDAFWRYADIIYARTSSNGNGLSADSLVPFAIEIGLDETKFSECLASGKMAARVEEDVREGVQIGISGTPGNIILNNKTGDAVPAAGALPFATLRGVINRLIKPAP